MSRRPETGLVEGLAHGRHHCSTSVQIFGILLLQRISKLSSLEASWSYEEMDQTVNRKEKRHESPPSINLNGSKASMGSSINLGSGGVKTSCSCGQHKLWWDSFEFWPVIGASWWNFQTWGTWSIDLSRCLIMIGNHGHPWSLSVFNFFILARDSYDRETRLRIHVLRSSWE